MTVSQHITGATLIKNGNTLGYPWKECIKNLLFMCNEVWVSVDPTGTDTTLSDLKSWAKNEPKLHIFESKWNMDNRTAGNELARQVNVMLPYMPKAGWILYLQADEMLHPSDRIRLKSFLNKQPESISQVELYRTYFWGDIRHRLPKHELWLGRIFRPGTHKIGGDGMWLERFSGDVARLEVLIYHYSRVGNPDLVTARIRSNDSLFHPEDEVEKFDDFSYNEYQTDELEKFLGSHPIGIEEFYSE